MAAVEKRKNIFVAIFTNHIIIAIVSAFIVMPLPDGIAKNIFGVIMSILFFLGLNDYSQREAIYHNRPYTPMSLNYKYPLFYALIANMYMWIPVIILMCYDSVWTRLLYLVLDSTFTYTNFVKLGENLRQFHILPAIILTVLNFAMCFLGYYLGAHDNSIAKIINKYIYGGKPRAPKKKR